ncbi:hypothetical protein CWI39_2575p0010, partial [Hamiltosporidium magnivora]
IDKGSKQQGVIDKGTGLEGVIDKGSKQQGVNDSTNTLHPFNNSTNYHPSSTITSTVILNTFTSILYMSPLNINNTLEWLLSTFNTSTLLNIYEILLTAYEECNNYKDKCIVESFRDKCKCSVCSNKDSSMLEGSYRDSNYKGVSDRSMIEGVNIRSTNYKGVSDKSMIEGVNIRSTNYKGFSDKDSNYKGVNTNSSNYKGFNTSTDTLHPLNNSTNTLHPLNNSTNTLNPLNDSNSNYKGVSNSTDIINPLNTITTYIPFTGIKEFSNNNIYTLITFIYKNIIITPYLDKLFITLYSRIYNYTYKVYIPKNIKYILRVYKGSRNSSDKNLIDNTSDRNLLDNSSNNTPLDNTSDKTLIDKGSNKTPLPTSSNTNTPLDNSSNTNTPLLTSKKINTPLVNSSDTNTPLLNSTNTNTPTTNNLIPFISHIITYLDTNTIITLLINYIYKLKVNPCNCYEDLYFYFNKYFYKNIKRYPLSSNKYKEIKGLYYIVKGYIENNIDVSDNNRVSDNSVSDNRVSDNRVGDIGDSVSDIGDNSVSDSSVSDNRVGDIGDNSVSDNRVSDNSDSNTLICIAITLSNILNIKSTFIEEYKVEGVSNKNKEYKGVSSIISKFEGISVVECDSIKGSSNYKGDNDSIKG